MPNRIASAHRFSLFTANKAEQKAFLKLFQKEKSHKLYFDGTYRQFRKNILYDTMNGCFRIILGGIYIGIESDGYTHT